MLERRLSLSSDQWQRTMRPKRKHRYSPGSILSALQQKALSISQVGDELDSPKRVATESHTQGTIMISLEPASKQTDSISSAEGTPWADIKSSGTTESTATATTTTTFVSNALSQQCHVESIALISGLFLPINVVHERDVERGPEAILLRQLMTRRD